MEYWRNIKKQKQNLKAAIGILTGNIISFKKKIFLLD